MEEALFDSARMSFGSIVIFSFLFPGKFDRPVTLLQLNAFPLTVLFDVDCFITVCGVFVLEQRLTSLYILTLNLSKNYLVYTDRVDCLHHSALYHSAL